jgi:Transposase DDE domain
MDILSVFCHIDDFCRRFEPAWQRHLLASTAKKRNRPSRFSLSEIMTILVLFHDPHYRTFKHFYLRQVREHWQAEFPALPSYSRFVELIPTVLLPLRAYRQTRQRTCTGIQFIDSLPIRVCHNRRIYSHRVFAALAQRGKNSVGWFYGFKLHFVINDLGEILGLPLTPGNVDDRRPGSKLVKKLWGKLFGDRGYISQELFEQLWGQGLQLITKGKRNMRNRLLPLIDKLLLRQRVLIECVNDQLKNISQIEHTRHRSATNGLVNMLAAVVAYTFQPKKPALDLFTQHGHKEESPLFAPALA